MSDLRLRIRRLQDRRLTGRTILVTNFLDGTLEWDGQKYTPAELRAALAGKAGLVVEMLDFSRVAAIPDQPPAGLFLAG